MRILVLHQNKFDRLAYDVAFDHDAHDVSYAGSKENIANIPERVRCQTFVWDAADPVVDQLRPWVAAQAPFDRVITRHESLIVPAAVLRDEFGIPGLSLAVAHSFRDKVAMKAAVSRAGLDTPRFLPADRLPDTAPWPGRTVVKPRDGAGSRDVSIFDSYPAARAFVHSELAADGDPETRRDAYEVEEYLAGPIWHVDGYLFDGQPVAVQASRYVHTCLDFERGHPLGSVQYPNPELEAWAVECVRALGGQSLTFHLEAIMTERGPVFLEVAARCGGAHIVDAFQYRTGVHLHTVDMASDVAGRLARHLITAPASDDLYGWFVYPGHTHGGTACEVSVPDEVIGAPLVLGYRIFPPGVPLPTTRSYRPENLPLAGMVAGPDPDALDGWIRELFDRASVRGVAVRGVA
jgi:hypothetical protein